MERHPCFFNNYVVNSEGNWCQPNTLLKSSNISYYDYRVKFYIGDKKVTRKVFEARIKAIDRIMTIIRKNNN